MPVSSQQWDERMIPPLNGKIAIVTGANVGLGFATSLPLVRAGAHVVLACRNKERGRQAEQKLRDLLAQQPSNNVDDAPTNQDDGSPTGSVEYMHLDLGSLASIATFAQACNSKFQCVDILVLNAGMKAVHHSTTVDGFEAQFGINHLGHFALTAQLFSLLRKSVHARVISISSISHFGCAIDFDNLNAGPPSYDAMKAYRISKLANLLFCYELDRRLKQHNIANVVSVGCHPGVTESNLLPNLMATYNSTIIRSIIKFVHSLPWAQSNGMGALDILCAATDPKVEGGEYIGPHGFWEISGYPRIKKSSKESYSLDDAQRLWQASEQLVNVEFPIA